MLMIVSYHSVHGEFNFPTTSITLNRLCMQFIFMGGNLGNDIFVMLSGYFLINSKGLKLRKLLDLYVKMFFWSVVIYAVFVISGHEAFSLRNMLRILRPISKGSWWFASAYFVLYIIHPYINRLLHSFTREEYRKFLLTVLICWCIIPTLTLYNFGGNETTTFICIYSIAGYARLYPDDFGKRNYIIWGLAFIGVNFLSVIVFDFIGIRYSLPEWMPRYFTGMMKPFTLLASLCFLLGFNNLNIPHSRVINVIASATFGVYLLHYNKFSTPFIWCEVFRVASFQDSPYLIPYIIAVVIVIYISCTLLELLRSGVFRVLSRGKFS